MAITNRTDTLRGHVVMLDLASPEVNRGSFCYLTYILYSAFMSKECPQIKAVTLHEEFRVGDLDGIMDDINSADTVLVGLWSYPQIDAALLLNRFLKGKCYFYGYYPLIAQLGLNQMQYTDEHLLLGIESYPQQLCQNTFKYDLLSDCDKHIKDTAKRTVSGIADKMVPFFTSYGCPMGCEFCSATVNCGKRVLYSSHNSVIDNLELLNQHGRTSIHFTDEDFFLKPIRASRILLNAYRINPHFEFIALGGMKTVEEFCAVVQESYAAEEQDAIWSVLKLIEIGLETVDPVVAKAMGKQGRSSAENAISVKSMVRCPVLWLTVTFFPGETIGSLNATGAFLKEHGFNPADLVERIVTNGTEGGLGQFFQYYEGAGLTMQEYGSSGVVLSARPMRLIPSFIPSSFLQSEFRVDMEVWNAKYDELVYWLGVYGIGSIPEGLAQLISKFKYGSVDPCNVLNVFRVLVYSSEYSLLSYSNNCIAIAIMARLNILKAV